MIFLYSFLDNFSYFRGIWFIFNVNNHHYTCIRGLLQNTIWFLWNNNLGRFEHHDLLPLDMKKEQLLQDTPPLNTAICFECPGYYCNGCQKNLHVLLYNNLAMTSLYSCPPSSLWLCTDLPPLLARFRVRYTHMMRAHGRRIARIPIPCVHIRIACVCILIACEANVCI